MVAERLAAGAFAQILALDVVALSAAVVVVVNRLLDAVGGRDLHVNLHSSGVAGSVML